ncbi:hypothetical protein F5Y00DRAFT_234399 [Daldinia vernicosa]|uniref:uncharacterized protein n=1 Tax=Daldinia vernicosa TaxID=114800 RepID=UPI0020074D9C|nr:uncharacterized protein F5Y00DRAFT_234399 [Daldinia vernicosa]KAI0849991.1 hypothetical protein F5Y00DRAFT_234399 [Daldinia vernicosa]
MLWLIVVRLRDCNTERLKKKEKKGGKTYNTGDSLVVTDPTTNPAVSGLSRGERTGSRIFQILWSYVTMSLAFPAYIYLRNLLRCADGLSSKHISTPYNPPYCNECYRKGGGLLDRVHMHFRRINNRSLSLLGIENGHKSTAFRWGRHLTRAITYPTNVHYCVTT